MGKCNHSSLLHPPIECCSQPIEHKYTVKKGNLYKDGVLYGEIISAKGGGYRGHTFEVRQISGNPYLNNLIHVIHVYDPI
jgi:hypothetical protein